MTRAVQIYRLLLDLIDLRSFSNLWYWIALAVMWSMLSHFILGVPHDMVMRARRGGGQAQRDLEDLAAIQARRRIDVVDRAGIWLLAVLFCLLTVLLVLGAFYGVEFAQAVFLMLAPLSLVQTLGIGAARRIVAGAAARGEALHGLLIRLRLQTQTLGVVAITATALWGMYVNIGHSILAH